MIAWWWLLPTLIAGFYLGAFVMAAMNMVKYDNARMEAEQ